MVSDFSSVTQALELGFPGQIDLILADQQLLASAENTHQLWKRYAAPVIPFLAEAEEIVSDRESKTGGVYLTGIDEPKEFDFPFLIREQELPIAIRSTLYQGELLHGLRLQAAYYRELFENAHDAILIFTPEKEIVLDVNRRACEIYGFSRDEFIGMSLESISNNVQRGKILVQETLHGGFSSNKGYSTSFVTHQRTKAGVQIILEVNASVVNYQGQPAILSINREITNRVRWEEELEKYHQQLEDLVRQRTQALQESNAALQKSNAQLNLQITALSSTSNGILITDREGIIQWVNPGFTRLTGYTSTEVIGQTPRLLKSGKQNQAFYAQMWATILAGDEWRGEIVNRHRDGSLYTEELVITPVKDSAGMVTHFVAVKEDITERILSEIALRESEGRYRQLVEYAPLLIAMLHQDVLTYINKEGAQMLGYAEPGEVMGRSLSEFIPSQSLQVLWQQGMTWRQEQLTAKRTSMPSNVEVQLFRKDGSKVDLDVSFSVTSFSPHLQVQIIGQDITERKRAQETLHRQAQLVEVELIISQPQDLSAALDKVAAIAKHTLSLGIGAAILLIDQQTKSVVAASDLVDMQEFQQPSPPSVFFQAFNWIAENKQPLVVEQISNSPYEHNQLVQRLGVQSGIGVPLLADEEVLGVLFAVDNQPRYYAPADVEFLTALANRAALAITKVRLTQSLSNAKEAAEKDALSRANYLARMSHELRTPLAAIVHLSELLEQTQLSSNQVKSLQAIKASSDHLLNLINDILDYSRLEADKLDLKIKEYNLLQVIDTSFELVGTPAAQKNLDISYFVGAGVPGILLGDPQRLGQVLTNLLSNAVKYTESGYIYLEVGMAQGDRENLIGEQIPAIPNSVALRFTIQDSGIGIPPQQLDRLFLPFSQIRAATFISETGASQPSSLNEEKLSQVAVSQRSSGSGLGLAICKELVHLMQGEIWVESSGIPGEGSTFSFTIQAGRVPGKEIPCLQNDPPELQGKKVALIYHSSAPRNLLVEQLKFWGIEVQVYNQLAEATRWLEAYPLHPDVAAILLDASSTFPADEWALAKAWLALPTQNRPEVIVYLQLGMHLGEYLAQVASATLYQPHSPSRLYQCLLGLWNRNISLAETNLALPTLKILLVDDDPVGRSALQLRLEQMGHQVKTASNGSQALTALQDTPFDLLFLDLQMPGIDGLETAHRIRSSLPPQRQPFIALLTAGATPEQQAALEPVGIDVYLLKPVRQERLLQVLAEVPISPHQRYPLHLGSSTDQPTARDQLIGTSVSEDLDNENVALVENFQLPTGLSSTLDISVLQDLIHSISSNLKPDRQPTEIFDLFFNSAPDLMEKIRRSASISEFNELRGNLHALKGTSEIFGATNLAKHCKNLEKELTSAKVDGLPAQIEKIEVEFQRVLADLARIRAALRQQPEGLIEDL